MFYGRQFLTTRFFHCTRDLGQRVYSPLFPSLSISMDTVSLRGYIWRRVDQEPLERRQT